MSAPRYSPEFKQEAIKQVTERGHSVAEVGTRLGVSSHSLYKWVKEVVPSKDEKQAAELIEAKGEILRLRAQMRRLEEERDLFNNLVLRRPVEFTLCSGVRTPTFIRDNNVIADTNDNTAASCETVAWPSR